MKGKNNLKIGRCKDCIFFNWKTSTDNGDFGYCMNEKNDDDNDKHAYISISPDLMGVHPNITSEVFDKIRKYIKEYENVRLNENIMGCINFKKK